MKRLAIATSVVVLFSLGACSAAQAYPDGNLIAFQANTGHLFTSSDGQATDTQLGMAGGTSPAIADGEIALQANTGELYLTDGAPSTGTNTHLGMAAGTSPSIAALSADNRLVAFQANTTQLYTRDASGNITNTGLGMMPGTSPSITAAPFDHGYIVAFQSNAGELWTYEACFCSANGRLVDTSQGMMGGTSPSIAAFPGGGYLIAFQANTGDLFVTNGTQYSSTDTHQQMLGHTSPSIAALPADHGYEVAYQASDTALSGYEACFCSSNGHNEDFGLGMKSGTSPSIAAPSDGGWTMSMQDNGGGLWTLERCMCEGVGGNATGLGMAAGTSPAIMLADPATPDQSVDADPGQAVTAIITEPGCASSTVDQCKSVMTVANTSAPLTSAQQRLLDSDMTTAQNESSGSTAQTASAGVRVVASRTLDTSATTASCSRGCRRYAYDHLCAFHNSGCSIWGQHTNEVYWYNGSQAWGGPGVNGSSIDCSNNNWTYPATGVDETLCQFQSDRGPWHNPAYASKHQHLSADNRFVVRYWGPRGVSEEGFHHIYFWDYPSGKVTVHKGNGY